jgi:hypothetical protein
MGWAVQDAIPGIPANSTPVASHLTAIAAQQLIGITFKYSYDRNWD